MIKPLTDLTEKELSGKKILLRVDFNVPVDNGEISEHFRIEANKETIDYLIKQGAIVVLLSHITAVDSFVSILGQIKNILGYDFSFIEHIGDFLKNDLKNASSGGILFLDNIRKYKEEKENDINFAKQLAEPFDFYINNAFSESHRNYASVTAVTKFLPSYAGFLLIKEIENLCKAIKSPKEGKTLILGGAKIDIKFPVIKNFLDKAQTILVGGAIANVFFNAQGIDIKKSLTDDNFSEDAKNIMKEKNLVIPSDYVISNDMILDIGQKTVDKFTEAINGSKMVIWNGPLGKAEILEFALGTKKIAEAIIKSGAFSVVGGGDTIAFLEKNSLVNKFSYVSTGGGAMLEFLAGKTLPGLVALDYK